MSIKNRRILQAAALGNSEAIQSIWQIWSPKVLIFMKNQNEISLSDAEDLHQEVMAKVFQSLSRYNPFYSPATWIYTIASRTLSDWRRKERIQIKVVRESSDQFPTEFKSPYKSPEEETIDREQISLVRDFIESQNPNDRQLLFLVCYEGLSGRKAAALMGTPPGTARDRLKKLKKELEEKLK